MTVRYLVLNTRCPVCGEPPLHIRTMAESLNLFAPDADPEAVVTTYRCRRKGCREVYEIRVKHFTEAA